MKKSGICIHTLIAVRSNPSERAELATQLLFGETFTIEEVTGNWVRITNTADNYEGWVDRKLITHFTEDELNQWNSTHHHTVDIPFTTIIARDNKTLKPIVAGSHLPINETNDTFSIGGISYTYIKLPNHDKNEEEKIVFVAKKFLNAPYLWGGKSILGIDCSGFAQLIYSIIGINLPRDASKQIALGKAINFTGESSPGDLAFFDNELGEIVHVGMMINSHEIIHASGFVRIDPIDHQGIYNHETNKYSHKLRIIKRIIV
jgi:gamma-D-glutamyl-L-lysine dipeptidyl-peptidase